MQDLTQQELLHLVWEFTERRVHPGTPREDLIRLLQFEDVPLLDNPINKMRDGIMAYIEDNRGRLSLPCHGECYKHPDAVVVHCWLQLKADQREEEKSSGQSQEEST